MGKSSKTGKSKKDKGIVEETLVEEETMINEKTRIGTMLDGTDSAEPETGKKSINEEASESSGARDSTYNRNNTPTTQEEWDLMKGLMAQLATLTKAVVADPVVQRVDNQNDDDSEVVEVNLQPNHGRKRGDYLSLLEHVSRLGTRHFMGSTDPIVADEWRSRLKRNFKSTRCPEDSQRDIAVHFLEGDAYNWWLTVKKRRGDEVRSFTDFENEFNKKYFPPEAWDRLECVYLDLVQGNRTVREYDEEFNRLRRYVGRELEEEQAQVRRFIRRLRIEIRNHCLVRTFNSVFELVERAVMIEEGIEEERYLNREKAPIQNNQPTQPADKKRKFDKVDNTKSDAKTGECVTCGKSHSGTCWKAIGACGQCGSKDHAIQSFPRMEPGQSKVLGEETRTCFYCGKVGHLKRECPKLTAEKQGGQRDNRGGNVLPPPPKRQAVAPRVYELSEEANDAGNFRAITGTFSQLPIHYFYNCICIASCIWERGGTQHSKGMCRDLESR